jgi:archaellum component FlaC
MSTEAPKLPKLPFIAADAALLALASAIAVRTPGPLDGGPLIATVVCVALGAVLLAIPFIADYGRRTDARLRERQDEIAALAQTTATSAEQLSIAASSLHGIADVASRSARALEGLPNKLQERINDLKAQLNEVAIAENEALEQEIQTLRSAESDRLVGAIDTLARQVGEVARLEAAFRQQVGEAAKAAAALARDSDAAGRRATEQSLAAAREFEARASEQRQRFAADLAAAQEQAVTALEAKLAHALSRIEQRLGAIPAPAIAPTPPPMEVPPASRVSPPATKAPAAPPASAAPVAPITAPEAVPVPPPAAADATATAPAARPRRASAALFEGQELDLGLPPPPAPKQSLPATPPTSTVSAERSTPDGVTRLLVTAYIGIGNRLFARGVGPGLHPDKGTPLQFISIGKWRWESADVSAPVTLRLFKNDESEAIGLGTLRLEPGKQRDVTAAF